MPCTLTCTCHMNVIHKTQARIILWTNAPPSPIPCISQGAHNSRPCYLQWPRVYLTAAWVSSGHVLSCSVLLPSTEKRCSTVSMCNVCIHDVRLLHRRSRQTFQEVFFFLEFCYLSVEKFSSRKSVKIWDVCFVLRYVSDFNLIAQNYNKT